MNKRAIVAVFLVLTTISSTKAVRGQEVLIPDPALNTALRAVLQKPDGPLTQQDLLSLTNLSVFSRGITNLQGLGSARNLTTLLLDDNRLSDSSFSNELETLTSLAVLDLAENAFTKFTLPNGLTNLTRLRIEVGQLAELTLPAGLTKLTELQLGFNQLTNLILPEDMTNLNLLSAYNNHLTNLALPQNLTKLSQLNLDGNQLSQLLLPAGLTNLTTVILGANNLTSFTLPADATNVIFLRLNDNQITNLVLPSGLGRLTLLHLPGNQFRDLALPSGLTNLTTLNLTGNQLTNLMLPADILELSAFSIDENPLTSLVLSESLSAGLGAVIEALQTSGVEVFPYPQIARLTAPTPLAGALQLRITGPPGTYLVLASTNLQDWSQAGIVSNRVGAIAFIDTNSLLFPKRFYRSMSAPPDLVFVPPNTFTMGSPTNDPDHSVDEEPQTTVVLTHGFWISRYEVTQSDYLSIMHTNPSFYPGDLRGPISSVSWFDATNYCAKLTERELAAGHIPRGTRFRLPTEAEWECAARAGTTTRFSYGDDATYNSTTNYAWELFNSDLIVHPVAQKLANPWGLYDVHGNVWEWCQDWYDTLSGGIQTDPTGPTGPVIFGSKVIRGGAYDYPDSSCRSATRLFSPAFNTDTDIGFRVVLAEQQ